MGGDYSRWTFDPTKDYAAVLKQQGRVDLDADWNEFVEITDRRWRAETLDLVGQCFVPASTPNAFLITPSGPNGFTIGIGRIYVDGLLVECHGLPPAQFDPVLGELQETNGVPYNDQPYFPSPLPPVIGAPGQTDLIYLDVWEREVTAIQDPNIREKALGGPDTTTRVQTVWQVKDLQNVGQHGCPDQIQGWDDLTAPSAGRLTTSTIVPNPSTSPCILSPTGGYRGLENRLYRVEVHAAGTVDGVSPAQFKWSRDNGAVVSSVTAISASGGTNSILNVQTLGRDRVLRFNAGDWVEVLDDFTELAGVAGHLAKIVSPPDQANLTLTIVPPIPASFNFDPANSGRHTRVRRWDQRADTNTNVDPASGLIEVTTGPVDIEDGIQVSFSADPVGGSLKIGDYWIFAARTVDGSVEALTNAPPRGILHHYCRLGFLTWAAAGTGSGTFSDCRPHGRECSCGGCTVTVGDGVDSQGQFTDIQKAIDSLGPAGGVVCVGRGVYTVTQTIQINSSNGHVTLLGMGAATRIIFAPGRESKSSVFLSINSTDHVTVEGLFVASLAATALIVIENSSFCTVRGCTLANLNMKAAAEVSFTGAGVASAAVQSGSAIVMAGDCFDCGIEKNALLAAKGISTATGISGGTANNLGRSVPGSVSSFLVRDNRFLAYHGALFINSANGLDVLHNEMRGLSPESLKQLQGNTSAQGLTRDNITAFQTAVTQAFAAPQGTSFMGTGIFLISGFRVNICQNRIAAQAAFVSFLVIETTLEDNEILALIGVFSLFAINLRIAGSLVAGLLAGYLQTGISLDVACEANTWFGFSGISFLPFSDFLQGAGSLLATALGSANIASNGNTIASSAQAVGEAAVGILRAFSLAATVKIHHNAFYTFLSGIRKQAGVISADFSIIDNSFTFCSQDGIFLGAQLGRFGSKLNPQQPTGLAGSITQFFNLRHLVQSNSFAVTGAGVSTACPFTQIRGNSLSCSSLGVDVFAEACDVQDNLMTGTAAQPLESTGLIAIEREANDVRVVNNRLLAGPGSGILLVTAIRGLVIEENEIQGMHQNGITAADSVTLLSDVSISRNKIQGCQGGAPSSKFWHAGAIVLAETAEARVCGNMIAENGTSTPPSAMHAIYLESVTGADISSNLITGNFTAAPAAGQVNGAIFLPLPSGEVLIHGNRIRGNGGFAVSVNDLKIPMTLLSIQSNYLDNTQKAAAAEAYLFMVLARAQGILHFENNFCSYVPAASSMLGIAVYLGSTNMIVNGNTIKTPPAQKNGLLWALYVQSAGTTAIVTSNLLTGGPAFPHSGTPLQANNLGI